MTNIISSSKIRRGRHSRDKHGDIKDIHIILTLNQYNWLRNQSGAISKDTTNNNQYLCKLVRDAIDQYIRANSKCMYCGTEHYINIEYHHRFVYPQF